MQVAPKAKQNPCGTGKIHVLYNLLKSRQRKSRQLEQTVLLISARDSRNLSISTQPEPALRCWHMMPPQRKASLHLHSHVHLDAFILRIRHAPTDTNTPCTNDTCVCVCVCFAYVSMCRHLKRIGPASVPCIFVYMHEFRNITYVICIHPHTCVHTRTHNICVYNCTHTFADYDFYDD